MKQELTILEFATFMKTTKDTLIHYDAIHLFKPAFRKDNGYRIYTPMQANNFLMIQAYREMGYSLSEIKVILNDQDSYETHKLTLKKRISQTIHHLEQTRFMLDCRDRYRQLFETIPFNTLFFETWDMGQFYTYPQFVTNDNFFETLAAMRTSPDIESIFASWMIGIRVSLSNDCARIFTPTNKSGQTQPIVGMVLPCDLEDLELPIKAFLTQCKAHQITPTSDVYVLQVTDELTMGPEFQSTVIVFARC